MGQGSLRTLKHLKSAIWVYLLLLIFEGALRKWILPGLSTPLLVIRDPVAIYILLMARTKGFLSFNPFSFWMIVIGVFATITAVLLGHGNLAVALYGARIFVIHFPLMFAFGEIFTRKDVIDFGKVLLWILPPMTILIIAQFYSPQSSFVNRGVGGDLTGAGFSGALGFYRPPGTFSFTNGNSLFYGLAAAYIFYFWFNNFLVNKILLVIATICLLLSIPFSISRTLLFEVSLSTVFMIIALWHKPKYLGRIFGAIIIALFAFLILQNQSFFATGTDAFTTRFTNANESEGGLNSVFMDRFLGGYDLCHRKCPELTFFWLWNRYGYKCRRYNVNRSNNISNC